MDAAFCEVENLDPAQHQKWIEKHGFSVTEDGRFDPSKFEGRIPVEFDKLIEYIKTNISAGDFKLLEPASLDDRTFVMVCGGPSLTDHLDEIRMKSRLRDDYLVVCSNKTAQYLIENDIIPHAHFVLDPQEHKKLDVANARSDIQYWINAACNPSVFAALKDQGIKPYVFLADFDPEKRAVNAVLESLPKNVDGNVFMCIQGGTMAGLRALNIAENLGHRKMEYYGFDACVRVKDGRAQNYAYRKKRGEAIIDVKCDKCDSVFPTTLIFQKQVNEFLYWRANFRHVDIKIIGGGLIDHAVKHAEEEERKNRSATYRFTSEYAALQKELHAKGNYGTTGGGYTPTIFHGISQLLKRFGSVNVLDYGSSSGLTMRTVREKLYVPPMVFDHLYDPFVEEHSAEPDPAHFVICTDVLEHVEPECTDAVLDHIQSLTRCIAFFSISLVPAQKMLSDGRNAHINLRTAEAWMKNLQKRFIISEVKATNDDLLVIALAIDDVRAVLRQKKAA